MWNVIQHLKRASAVVLLAITLITTHHYLTLSTRTAYQTFSFNSVPDIACQDVDSNRTYTGEKKLSIPSIAHFVWLLKDPVELRLSFEIFLSIYSSSVFWHPDKIYLHTDATPETFKKAQVSGDTWTRRTLAIPGIIPNYVEAPQVTAKGIKIVNLEHKSDFVRIAALRDFGGVYLDKDVVPLRDIAGLRHSGFANVLGGVVSLSMKRSAEISNGLMMSVPESTLMKIYYHAAQQTFDGGWDTAGVFLLTDLANRLLPIPSEVLILQPQAFAPISWELADRKLLFQPKLHLTQLEASPLPKEPKCDDALAWLRSRREKKKGDARELDFSSSYAIHTFYEPDVLVWGEEIDVKHVFRRQSNFARAVFPAVRHAVQAGIIPIEETV